MGNELKLRMESAMREIVKNRGLEKQLEQLEKAHIEQATLLQKFQKDNKKISMYRETARSQEKVIGKLEKVLEASIGDLQKAQEQHTEFESLKRENMRLKDDLMALQKEAEVLGQAGTELSEIKKSKRAKELEVEKLQQILIQVQEQGGGVGGRAGSPGSGRSAGGGGQQSARLQQEKQLLIYKIQQLENRIRTSEEAIRATTKEQSKELAQLKVEIARKDAQIRALKNN